MAAHAKKWKHVHARETHWCLPKRLDVPDKSVYWEENKDKEYEKEYEKSVKIWPEEDGPDPTCPKNPYGRTGLGGKGILPNFGPNEAVEPVITRSVMLNGGKQTQVLVCKEFAESTFYFSLPGGRLSEEDKTDGDKTKIRPIRRKVDVYLKRLLNTNYKAIKAKLCKKRTLHPDDKVTMLSLRTLHREYHKCKLTLDMALNFEKGVIVYPNNCYEDGYCDDPRNTDHAWIKAEVRHFHIPGAASGNYDFFEIRDIESRKFVVENSRGEERHVEFSWLTVDKGSSTYRRLYGSHKFFVDLCLPMCECGRTKYDRQDDSHRCRNSQLSLNAIDAILECEESWLRTDGDNQAHHQGSESTAGSRQPPLNPFRNIQSHVPGHLKKVGRNLACHAVITRLNWQSGKTQVLLCRSIEDDGKFDASMYDVYRLYSDTWIEDDQIAEMREFPVQEQFRFLCEVYPNHVDALQQALHKSKGRYVPSKSEWLYCDDPRNTNEAWIETQLIHFHMHQHDMDLENRTCSEDKFKWFDVETTRGHSQRPYFGSLSFFVELCVPNCCNCGSPVFDRHLGQLGESSISSNFSAEAPNTANPGTNIESFKADQVCGRMRFECSSAVAKFVRARIENDEDAVQVCRKLFGRLKPQMGSPEMWDWDKIRKFWTPKAVISITGGAQVIDGESELQQEMRQEMRHLVFNEGILKAAVGMNALIVDGGTSTGVMKEMGEVIARENRVPALGVCAWGAVLGRHNLKFEKSGERSSVLLENQICTYRNSEDHPNSDWGARLDPNHHFFALVDPGYHGGKMAFGKEIPGRALLENALAFGNQDKIIPHVLVVVNGGPNTIKTVYNLVSGKSDFRGDTCTGTDDDDLSRVMPIVVVDGTGRAADMLASCWNHLHQDGMRECTAGIFRQRCISSVKPGLEKNEEKIEDVQCPFLRKEYLRCFPKSESSMDDGDKELLSEIVSVCRKRDQVTVYTSYQSTSLCYAIMKSVIKGSQIFDQYKGVSVLQTVGRVKDALKMLLSWKEIETEAVELARIELIGRLSSMDTLDEDSDGKILQNEAFYEVWLCALKKDSIGFVNLLQDSGVLCIETWKSHWPRSIQCQDQRLVQPRQNRRELEQDQQVEQANCNKLKPSLSFFSYSQRMKSPENSSAPSSGKSEVNALLCSDMEWHNLIFHRSTKDTVSDLVELYIGWTRYCPNDNILSSPCSEAAASAFMVEEMFLWSVLSGRLEMAEMYWSKWHPSSRHHCITTALFACALSRAASQSISFRGSRRDRDRLEQIAIRFERVAAEILEKCAQSSTAAAVISLSVEYMQPFGCPCWLDSNENVLTPINVAYYSKAMSFVALDVFQEALDQIWFGRLVGDMQPQRESKELFRGTKIQLWPMRLYWCACCAFCPILVCFLKIEKFDASFMKRTIHKLCAFYTAPCTKFVLSFFFYLAFVLLYTCVGYFMDHNYSSAEQTLHFWFLALVLAEIRQILHQGPRLYFLIRSNVLDMLMLVVYIPVFGIRRHEISCFSDSGMNSAIPKTNGSNRTIFTVPRTNGSQPSSFCETVTYLLQGSNSSTVYEYLGEDLTIARSLHGIAGIFFWVRSFYFLRVSSTLGPLWLVLFRVTCKDVFNFLVFLFVFLFSFGAAIVCSARSSHESGVAFSAYLADTLYFPYMEIYGEHFLESIYFSSHPDGPTVSDNRVLGTLLLCVYLLFSAVVLMNLLIAQMNSTYNAIHDESVKTWKFQRLGLVLEFCSSSVLPAPFGLLEDLNWIFYFVCSATSRRLSTWLTPSSNGSPSKVMPVCKFYCDEETRDPGEVLPLLRITNDQTKLVEWFPEDWFEWRALGLARRHQQSWLRGVWPGYFRRSDCSDLLHVCGMEGHPSPILVATGSTTSQSHQISRGQRKDNTNSNRNICACVCLQCQGRLLRSSADAVNEALGAWWRMNAAKEHQTKEIAVKMQAKLKKAEARNPEEDKSKAVDSDWDGRTNPHLM